MKSDSVNNGLGAHRIPVTAKTKERLRKRAKWYENNFPKRDPSRLLKVRGKKNQEATAFVAACLSFGSVEQFMPKIKQLIKLAREYGGMDKWIREGAFVNNIPVDAHGCFYRFVTYENLRAFLCRYRQIMHEPKTRTLGEYVQARLDKYEKIGDDRGLAAVKIICSAFAGTGVGYLVPMDASSACKRICLFLRWMVRSNSRVDLGLWKDFIDCKSLIMPLDTHVLQQARKLRLLANESATMATARKLTAIMSEVFPGDPLRGDFALFGQGRAGGN